MKQIRQSDEQQEASRVEGCARLFGVGNWLKLKRPEWDAVLDLNREGGFFYARCWIDGRFAECGVHRDAVRAVEALGVALRNHKGVEEL